MKAQSPVELQLMHLLTSITTNIVPNYIRVVNDRRQVNGNLKGKCIKIAKKERRQGVVDVMIAIMLH